MAIKSVKPNIHFLSYDKLKNAAKKDDEQILFEAAETALAKSKNNSIAKAQRALPYVVAGALSIGIGAQTPGALSKKVVKGAQIIGFYAMMDAVLNTFYGAKNLAENKFKKGESKKETRHPFLKSLASIGAGLVVLNMFSRGLFYGVNKIIKNKPQVVKNAMGKVQKGLDAIDKSAIASKVEEFRPKYNSFKLKHPKLVSKVSDNLFPIALASYGAGAIGLGIKSSKKREDIFKDNVVQDVINRKIASEILK